MCSLDWTLIKDILGSISAVVVVVLAFVGLNRWRDELRGRSKFQVARNILRQALEFRDAYDKARNPLYNQLEARQRIPDSNEPQEQKTLRDEYFVRSNRVSAMEQAFERFSLAVRDAEIFLDEDSKSILQPVDEARGELTGTLLAYYQLKINGSIDPAFELSVKDTVYPVDDQNSNKAHVAFTQLKEKLKQYL